MQKESIGEDVSKLLQKLEQISQEYSDLQTQRVASDAEFTNTQDKFNSLYDRINEIKLYDDVKVVCWRFRFSTKCVA